MQVQKIKDIVSDNRRLIWETIIHAVFIWFSLVLSYNSFKEYFKMYHNVLPVEFKEDVKATFLWAIMTIVVLSLLYGIWKSKKGGDSSKSNLAMITTGQAVVMNLIFFVHGMPVLIVQNLAIIYFVFLSFLWRKVIQWKSLNAANQIIDVFLLRISGQFYASMPMVKRYLNEKPTSHLAIGFVVLLIICGILLILKQGRIVERLEDVAYFLLLIGVGIELYQFMKQGNIDGKKED